MFEVLVDGRKILRITKHNNDAPSREVVFDDLSDDVQEKILSAIVDEET